MIEITGEELKKIAFQRRITSWTADRCATCDYPIKYVFQANDPEVLHDPGCTCSEETARPRYIRSSWNALALYMTGLTDLEQIEKTKKFWGL